MMKKMKTAILDVGSTLIGAPDLFEELAGIFDGIASKSEIVSDVASLFKVKFKHQRETNTKFMTDVFVNKSYLYSDTLPFLESLRDKRVRVLCASDADAWLIHKEFERFKIADFFDGYCMSSDINAYKPTDKFVNSFKSMFNYDKSKTIMVGDAVVDIQTGKKLNVKTAFVNRGEKHINMDSDYSVTDLTELLQLFNWM